MPALKKLSGKEVVKIMCNNFGFVTKRQRGSHMILVKEDAHGKTGCVVPMHAELKIGTLKCILKQAGIPEEEFSEFA